MDPKSTFIFLFSLFLYLSSASWAKDIWDSSLSYGQVVAKAKDGSPYHMGLLGIYLRSGEAGCSVNVDASRQWSEAALKKGHPFGSYNLANLAMLKGDFSEATRLYQDAALLLQRRASDGDAVAMYCMGEIDFQVLPTNVPRALDLFQKSADAGYPQAQATIGALYLKGLPGLLDRNPEKGVDLLSRAVRAKSLTARFNLGMAYYNGDGVPQDLSKAAQWLQVAEKQNFVEAQYVLGMLLAEGEEGLPKNLSQGVRLLNKADKQGHKLARAYLEKMDLKPGTISNKVLQTTTSNFSNMTSSEDEKILHEARKYYTGIGRPKNYEKAYSMLLPLAKGGYPEAARLVGLMKLSGKGTEKNPKDAKQWLSVAAQKGDGVARRMLEQYKRLF
ncbi:SEL1-like repeat protein [Opitutales bacterium]|nr:SEL1-like repeat protein [Opitutales bacterium]MDB3958541.1 SEL1-like repeat protein [Opitutales bacterium]